MSHQASDDPSPPPAPPAPSPPSPSFFSSSFFSASYISAFSLLFAGGLASLLGFASLLVAGLAEAAFALPGYSYAYADAYIAAYIACSSSSIPCSNRKFAAISSFLSHAKKASAARAFEKPRLTKRSIDSISSGVTWIDPGGGRAPRPAPAPPAPPAPPPPPPPSPYIGSCPNMSDIRIPGFCCIALNIAGCVY